VLSVFICDDEQYYRNLIFGFIQNYIIMEEIDMEIALCTADPAKIIQHLERNKINGLYFLDVELEGGYNGIEMARRIRKHDPRGFIVFVSAHPRYMSLTFEYKVEALSYIHKTDDKTIQKNIHDCIENAYAKYVSRPGEGSYIFKSQNGSLVSCGFDDILFIETEPQNTKRVILHTKKRQHRFYSTLDEISKELPVGLFFRCHKSFIVNTKNIAEKAAEDLRGGEDRIIMQNGLACLVSTRKKHGLLKLLES